MTPEAWLASVSSGVPTVLAVSVAEHGLRETIARRAKRFVRESGRDPGPFLLPFPFPVRSLPEITRFERGRGSDIGAPDPDGIVRRIPLSLWRRKVIMPALALETLRVAAGAGSVGIVTSRVGVRGRPSAISSCPPMRRAGAYPYFTLRMMSATFRRLDILDGSYDPAKLRGAAVFLGVTALGVVDEKANSSRI